MIALATLLLCGMHTSCTRGNNPAHVATVDSMITVTDSLSRMVKAIDVNALRDLDSIYRSQAGALAERLKDTLGKEDAIAIGNYRRAMTGTFGTVTQGYDASLKDLALQHEQLHNLAHDVQHGLLPPGPENTYIGQERLFLTSIAERVDVLVASASSVERNWDMYHARVDSLLATR